MLASLFYKTHHPEIYHGHGDTGEHFFEGWYFKIVDSDASSAWAVIPGIYKSKKNSEHEEAFIMILDGRTHKSTYHSFPADSFEADHKIFDITIGKTNKFSCSGLTLDLPEIKGSVTFKGNVPWPVTWLSPGIMGWYAYFPMECYHGLLSMDHKIHGQLETPSGPINFEGGRGYIEKDWGNHFPQNWIWIQANHFPSAPGSSVSISIARIPFYGMVFPGFIIGFWHKGVLHRFTTYVSGVSLERVKVTDEKVHVTVRNSTHRLEVATAPAPTALLHMPTKGQGMVEAVEESVGAIVGVQLYQINSSSATPDELLFEDTSHHGGLEVFGDVSMLLCGGDEQ